jgi:hypothetical protein
MITFLLLISLSPFLFFITTAVNHHMSILFLNKTQPKITFGPPFQSDRRAGIFDPSCRKLHRRLPEFSCDFISFSFSSLLSHIM